VPPAAIDPDDVAALLAVPPEEFVAARTARVKELKAEGKKDEATALGKLRKPVRLVWIVGELARRHPDVAGAAADVATELEEAQAGGGGVRPLLKRFRDVVGQVAGLADEIEGTVDTLEVGLALREVLADPDAREEWLGGRLLALPGDDDEEEGSPPADELAPRRAKKQAAAEEAEKESAAERREREKREKAQRAADAEVEKAQAAVDAAGAARDEAAATLADLEEQLAELEAKVADVRTAVETAEAKATKAEEDLAAATEARAALD
jgi:chromosome segregation ATPase